MLPTTFPAGAQFSYDSLGNVNGLLSPLGRAIQLLGANSVCLVGDSRVMKTHTLYSPTVGSVTAGILTITQATHLRIPGERINLALIATIGGVAHTEVNKDYTVLDLVDANNFRIDLGNAALSGSVVGSGAGAIYQYASLREMSSDGWPYWALILSGGRMQFVDNFAIGGAAFNGGIASDIVNQVAKAIATGCRNIVMDAYINDALTRSSEATVWAEIKTIYAMCLAANVTLYDCSTVHLGTAHSTYASAETGYTNSGHRTNVMVTAMNERRKRFARANPGVIYVPLAEALVDVTSTTGATLTANLADGIHDNVTGARAAGQVLATILNTRHPAADILPYCAIEGNSRQGSGANVVDRWVSSNPLLNDGAETAGLAANWATGLASCTVVTNTVTRVAATDGDAAGKTQHCVITASGAGSFTLRTSGSSHYSVADMLRAVSNVKLTSMTNVTYLLAYLNVPMKNSLGVDTTYVAQWGTTATSFDQTDLPVMVFSPTMPAFPAGFLDAASPNCSCGIIVGFGGVGGATLDVARGVAEKLPTL